MLDAVFDERLHPNHLVRNLRSDPDYAWNFHGKINSMRKIELIVLHCSGVDSDKENAATIRRFHTTPVSDGGRGWNDIGYHFVIPKSGLIERGRPLDQPGAHAAPKNHNSIGICVTGNKDFQEIQFESLTTLLLLLRLIPEIRGAKVVPHNVINTDKTCPNFDVSAFSAVFAGS